MGDYTQRDRELTTLADGFEGPEKERESFRARVSEYLAARRRRLDELVEAAGAIAGGADDSESRWARPAADLAEDAGRALGGLLSGISEPSAAAVALRWRIQDEEARFIQPLRDLGVAARWGQLPRLLRELQTLDRALRARWAALLDKGRAIDDAQGQRCDHLRETLAAQCAESGRRAEAIAGQLRDAAADLGRLREGTDADGWHERARRGVESGGAAVARALDELAADARALRAAAEAARRDLSALRGLQEAEVGGLHYLFREARREAEEFARAPTPERARALLREGRDLLDRWASALPSAAQQSDGAALARELSGRMEAAQGQIDAAWQDLLREHEGRFLRAPSSTTREALGRPGAWSSRQGALAGFPRALTDLRGAVDALQPAALEQAYQALSAAVQARRDGYERRFAGAEEHRRGLDERHARARAELRAYLPTDADLDAFILDYDFRDALGHLSYDLPSDLTRSDKMNVIFERYGADVVLGKARSVFEVKHPFDENDMPTRRNEHPVSESDREVLLNILKTDADLDALAGDHYRRAYDEFTGSMTRRRKAALILSHYGATEVLAKAREYFIERHPFDERDMPTRRGDYTVSEGDRDALLGTLKTEAELDAFAMEYARRAYGEFKSGVTPRQKAGLILSRHGPEMLAKAKEYYAKIHPFDERDRPTRPGGHPVNEGDRDAIVRGLRTDAELTAFAQDYFPRAATDFTGSMTTTQKASVLLWHYGASEVLGKLRKVIEERDRPR